MAFLVLTGTPGAAQNIISIPMDKTFIVTGFTTTTGKSAVSRKPNIIVFHKVIKHNNQTYVCGGYFGYGFSVKEFIRRGKVTDPNAGVLVRYLT